ncbi:nitroreductase family protein [Spiroplasma culicicola]|uniref:Nitroreductase n=1 Tax=Spiroplasma culicicola AES-1 TaxID=1276246 RepID=W6A6M3_9MOLU|nr:nitroreductase family protein [Spiroplasma culicicola]AHI52525.1 Nitroreductase [Spiroplasma culicicola AES-1]
MTKSLELLNSRRSAKRFVSDFTLTDEQINELLESIRLAPSSFGMEPFRALFISNKEIREELLAPWWDQPGVTTSSGMLIWITPSLELIENELIESQNKRNIPDGFENIREFMVAGLKNVWTQHEMNSNEWSSRQAYISLGTVLNTAEEMGIDLCPSEGFDPKAVAAVLEKHGLMDSKKEKVVVGSFVGKVDENQEFHHFFSKTRKPASESYKIVK